MKTPVKLFLVCGCSIGLFIFMIISTWESEDIDTSPEIDANIYADELNITWTGKKKINETSSHKPLTSSKLLKLKKGKLKKGHIEMRQFYLDQLRSTLPKSPQVYQGTSDYMSRLKRADEVCQQLNITKKRDLYSGLLLQKRFGLVICSIPKVGSTFWRQTFDVLEGLEGITSPFLIGYNALSTRIKLQNLTNRETLLEESTKFMFVREPYGRLFSAYVSKLVLPNLYHWRTLGRYIVMHTRKNSTRLSIRCGHDVTFPELVKYFIQGKIINDKHFTPQNELCNPCDVKYDVIGKVETFQDDALYLLDSIGALNKDISFYDLKKEHQQDSMIVPAITTFNTRGGLSNCISMYKAIKRVWRVYQITGVLDKTQECPLTVKESMEITLSEFMALAIAAHRKSDSSARGNKREALIQAYKGVPMEDLKLLKEKFDNDFKLFGYPSEPEYLFKRNDEAETEHTDFNYFDFT